MKRSLTRFITTAMLAATLLPVSTGFSHAGTGELVRLKGEGFRTCQALGDTGYTGIVRGRTLNGLSRNDFGQFSVRMCFETSRQCNRFVDRFPNAVKGIFDIRYSQCSLRG